MKSKNQLIEPFHVYCLGKWIGWYRADLHRSYIAHSVLSEIFVKSQHFQGRFHRESRQLELVSEPSRCDALPLERSTKFFLSCSHRVHGRPCGVWEPGSCGTLDRRRNNRKKFVSPYESSSSNLHHESRGVKEIWGGGWSRGRGPWIRPNARGLTGRLSLPDFLQLPRPRVCGVRGTLGPVGPSTQRPVLVLDSQGRGQLLAELAARVGRGAAVSVLLPRGRRARRRGVVRGRLLNGVHAHVVEPLQGALGILEGQAGERGHLLLLQGRVDVGSAEVQHVPGQRHPPETRPAFLRRWTPARSIGDLHGLDAHYVWVDGSDALVYGLFERFRLLHLGRVFKDLEPDVEVGGHFRYHGVPPVLEVVGHERLVLTHLHEPHDPAELHARHLGRPPEGEAHVEREAEELDDVVDEEHDLLVLVQTLLRDRVEDARMRERDAELVVLEVDALEELGLRFDEASQSPVHQLPFLGADVHNFHHLTGVDFALTQNLQRKSRYFLHNDKTEKFLAAHPHSEEMSTLRNQDPKQIPRGGLLSSDSLFQSVKRILPWTCVPCKIKNTKF